MAENKEKICRLCLNTEDEVIKIEACVIGKLKVIVPELSLSFPNTVFICSKCNGILERSFELQRIFSKNSETIQKERGQSGSENVDLDKIVEGAESNPDSRVCRICFVRGVSYTPIDKESNEEFNNTLNYCLPEIDISLTDKPVVCDSCRELLTDMDHFKRECLAVDEKVQSFVDGKSEEDVDLHKVLLNRSDEENDFLSGFEVQDEDGDIFEVPVEEESRKRSASESQQDDNVESKKPKVEELAENELPPFQFNSNLLFNPNKIEFVVEDWLEKVEEQKQKNRWSDYVTIHKVLMNLKGMKELYIWFSNIADIMDWEQWKRKLVRAFPGRHDYHIHLKKMILRKKRKEETYVSYYHDKMKLMSVLNLTEEQKVSCIFGGITDVLVCCVGRVGDYKRPEEILDYFKSCDDKRTIEAVSENNSGLKTDRAKANASSTFFGSSGNAHHQANNPAHMVKKKKMKCFECRRYGHSAIECRRSISDPMDRVEATRSLSGPRLSPPHKETKKPKSNIPICAMCGKTGHTSNKCRQQPKQSLKSKPSPKPKPFSQERCTVCHKIGHKMDNCFKLHAKNQKKAEPVGVVEEWSRCRDCGKFGSNFSPCCSARLAGNGQFNVIPTQISEWNKQICLRCYKPGHPTKDCDAFSRRMYRN